MWYTFMCMAYVYSVVGLCANPSLVFSQHCAAPRPGRKWTWELRLPPLSLAVTVQSSLCLSPWYQVGSCVRLQPLMPRADHRPRAALLPGSRGLVVWGLWSQGQNTGEGLLDYYMNEASWGLLGFWSLGSLVDPR